MTWPDILDMPQGELVEHVDQLQRWAAIRAGVELKD